MNSKWDVKSKLATVETLRIPCRPDFFCNLWGIPCSVLKGHRNFEFLVRICCFHMLKFCPSSWVGLVLLQCFPCWFLFVYFLPYPFCWTACCIYIQVLFIVKSAHLSKKKQNLWWYTRWSLLLHRLWIRNTHWFWVLCLTYGR